MFRQEIISKAVGAVAALVILSGCAASSYGTSETHSTRTEKYQEDEKGFAGVWMDYTQSRRNVITEIQGNPFGMDQDVFNLVTAQVLTAQQPGPRMLFQPTVFDQDLPGQAPREQYRFVIVFNPASTLSGQELCAGANVSTTASTDGRLAVVTAFCRNQEFLSGAMSKIGNVASVRDRGFSRAISHVLSGMFQKKPGNMAKGDNYDQPYDQTTFDFAWGCDRWLTCGLNNRLRSPDFR